MTQEDPKLEDFDIDDLEIIGWRWLGACPCQGQDADCQMDNDNWAAICPECNRDCYYESVPPYHMDKVAWYCPDSACGWWWG